MECNFENTLCLSARLANIWRFVMHENKWQEYCAVSTEFNVIWYNYTLDAPVNVKEFGEKLWVEILENFKGSDQMGKVILAKSPINTISRNTKLWDK